MDIPRLDRDVLEEIYAKGIEYGEEKTHRPLSPSSHRGDERDHVPLSRRAIERVSDSGDPAPSGNGKVLLDLGCNWGRWSIAASRLGYQVFGIDPNPEAVFAAYRVAEKAAPESNPPRFIVGDARFIPFRDGTADQVYSYGVLQHFSRGDVRLALNETHRVLKVGGKALIQMANSFGLRSAYQQLRRGFSDGEKFDVRYWTPDELRSTWEACVGPSQLSADGFLNLNRSEGKYTCSRRFSAPSRLSPILSSRFPRKSRPCAILPIVFSSTPSAKSNIRRSCTRSFWPAPPSIAVSSFRG